MHVVIAGCGRVGSLLALELAGQGHDVAVIDKDRRAFRRLGEDFPGATLHGIVFDRRTLEEAGVKHARAFVAVTSGDNSNIVSARTAKDGYGVQHVVARIYDPVRARIFERLGITTVASARWTAEEVLRVVLPEEEHVGASLGPGQGDVVIITATVPSGIRGVPAERLTVPDQAVLVAVTREGRTHVPVTGGLLEGGDRVHLAVQRDATSRVRDLVADLAQERA